MKIKITKKRLEDLRADIEVIARFVHCFPKCSYRADWTLEEQIRFIQSPMRPCFGWMASQRLFPVWSMDDLDLSKINMSEINHGGLSFYRTNLSESNLSKSYLSGVSFLDANLSKIDLSGSNLSGAEFYDVNLSGANLSNANLSRTLFFRADLSYADFSRSGLENSAFLLCKNKDKAIGLNKEDTK